jgi:anti-sigma regulatory factor (Ser/Thr protein kinase)
VGEHATPLIDREFDRSGIADVRREIERCSASAGLADPALYRFVVAVNEVVTNAVRHGGGRGRLRLWREDSNLVCRVTDAGPGMPAERMVAGPRPEPGTVGGWGLWLAREGSDELTVDAGPEGSAVTLVRSLDGARANVGAAAG